MRETNIAVQDPSELRTFSKHGRARITTTFNRVMTGCSVNIIPEKDG